MTPIQSRYSLFEDFDVTGQGKMLDEFELDTAKYDPNRFYLETKDKDGHRQYMSVSVPDDIMGHIERIVDSKLFPYRGKQDYYRNAVIHQMFKDSALLADENFVMSEDSRKLAEYHAAKSRFAMETAERESIKELKNIIKAWMVEDFNKAQEMLKELRETTTSPEVLDFIEGFIR